MTESTGTGMPLEVYTKMTPPGWRPGMAHYPFRRFMERLRLWYRMTDLDASQVGPAVAGRLQGKPFNVAIGMRFVSDTGVELVGDEALAYAGAPQVVDPITGALVQPAQATGSFASSRGCMAPTPSRPSRPPSTRSST